MASGRKGLYDDLFGLSNSDGKFLATEPGGVHNSHVLPILY